MFNKFHVLKVAVLGSSDMSLYPCESITTIQIMNMIPQGFLVSLSSHFPGPHLQVQLSVFCHYGLFALFI